METSLEAVATQMNGRLSESEAQQGKVQAALQAALAAPGGGTALLQVAKELETKSQELEKLREVLEQTSSAAEMVGHAAPRFLRMRPRPASVLEGHHLTPRCCSPIDLPCHHSPHYTYQHHTATYTFPQKRRRYLTCALWQLCAERVGTEGCNRQSCGRHGRVQLRHGCHCCQEAVLHAEGATASALCSYIDGDRPTPRWSAFSFSVFRTVRLIHQ